MKINYAIMTGITLLFFSLSLQAEQKQSLGHWDVHYSAFASTFLSADVASAYGIKRSRYSGIITIAVLENKENKAQEVTITGNAKNLLGIHKPLKFKAIKEGTAVYYIAELSYRNEESYQLMLTIKQGSEAQALKFQHTFYVE